MAHKFTIGQIVELEPGSLRSAVRGPYEIRHLVPASDRDPGDPCYRIKRTAEKHERIAPESELTLSKGVFAKVVAGPMLNFPNRSRSFDPSRRAVRFWGHDSAMEWSFFVTAEALKRLHPKTERDEASVLLAFDANRSAVYAVAMKAYRCGQNCSDCPSPVETP